MKAITIAERVENALNSQSSFDAKTAKLFTVVTDDDGGVSLTFTAENGDVYELLDNPLAKQLAKAESTQFIALVTCGWAAPLANDDDDDENGDEVAPSRHPQRRRVRLTVIANRESVASVIRFQDDDENTVTDDGKARGSLADAVGDLFK